jgi:hypothetical protein
MSIYDKASLIQIPSGYRAGELYSVIPNSGAGDFTVTGDAEGDATRVNSQGLIETVNANVPRLDYPFIDGVVQDCPRLLLEPQRTNYAPYSEDFNNWGDIGTTITPNAIISPNGTLNASKLVSTANNWRKSSSFTASSGVEYTVSIYAKLDTSTSTTTTRLEVYNGAGSLAANYNLSNETISNSGFTSVFIERLKDDWYRIGGTYTAGGTNNILYVYPSAGYGTAGTMYFWGAQQEEGTYASSYISTNGSSVTRTGDDFESNFTGLTSTAGTIFLDFTTKALDFNFARLFAVKDSVTNEGLYLGIYSTNTIAFFNINSGSGLPAVKDNISFNERVKIALTFDGNGNYKYSFNGSIQTGTYSGTTRQYDKIGRGNVIGGSSNNISIYQLMMFNEVLSSSELQTLTTL